MTQKISRRELFHSFLHSGQTDEADSREDAGLAGDKVEPDWTAHLPPEFSGEMLRQEVIRLGGDPEAMSANEMACLVLQAMQGQRS